MKALLAVLLALVLAAPSLASAAPIDTPAATAADCAGAGAWMTAVIQSRLATASMIQDAVAVLAHSAKPPADAQDRLIATAEALEHQADHIQALPTPEAAKAVQAESVEHDRTQAQGFRLFAAYFAGNDDNADDLAANRIHQATALGVTTARDLQAVVNQCRLRVEPQFAAVVGCVDYSAALASDWGQLIRYSVPVWSVLIEQVETNTPQDNAKLEQMLWSDWQNLRSRDVPPGAEPMNHVAVTLLQHGVVALEQAAAGDRGQLAGAAAEAKTALDRLQAAQAQMYAPCQQLSEATKE